MRNYSTFKQLLKVDRKTVLQYQLLFNQSLQDLHPLDTIEDFKLQIQRYPHKAGKSYFKYIDIDPKDINSIEDLYKYKDAKIIKCYKDIGKTNYYLNDNHSKLEGVKYASKEELIKALEEKIKEKTELININISLTQSQINNTFRVSINTPMENYLQHIKNNIKPLIAYQMKTKTPLTEIVKYKKQVDFMTQVVEDRRGMVNYSRRFKDIKILDYINYDNINRYNFYVSICTKWGGEIVDIEFENLDETKKYIEEYQQKYDIKFKTYDIRYLKMDKQTFGKKILEESVTIEINIDLDRDECEKIELGNKEDYIDTSTLETLHEFKDYRFTHGLQAYYKHRQPFKESVETLVNRNNIHISCSYKHNHIGNIGVYLKGDCKFASHFDLYSVCDRETGKRFIHNEINEEHIIKSPKEIIYINLPGEAILTNFNIVGIWVREGQYDEQDLNILKEMTGISNIEVIK